MSQYLQYAPNTFILPLPLPVSSDVGREIVGWQYSLDGRMQAEIERTLSDAIGDAVPPPLGTHFGRRRQVTTVSLGTAAHPPG